MVFGFFSSNVSVDLNKRGDEYFAGDSVKGSVKLSTFRGVNARNIKVRLCCVEWVNPKKNGGKNGEGKETVLWEKEKKLGGAHKYSAGKWKFEFKLPTDALPTITPEPYKKNINEGAGLKWYLHAQIDIPAGVDMHAYKQIFLY